MAREVFVDASAWVAVVSRRDQHHTVAVNIYRRIIAEQRALITTNLVVAEAYNGIRRYSTATESARFLASLRGSSQVIKMYSDEALEVEAEQWLRRYADHDFSLADAVSFAIMRQRRIMEAFTFDNHFAVAGFVLLE